MRSSASSKWAVEHPWSTDDPDKPWNKNQERHPPSITADYTPSPLEVRDAVQDLLSETLTERERDVVHLLVDEGLSLQATAEALGLHARSHIWRVRERAFAKLRAAISNHPILKEINAYNDYHRV